MSGRREVARLSGRRARTSLTAVRGAHCRACQRPAAAARGAAGCKAGFRSSSGPFWIHKAPHGKSLAARRIRRLRPRNSRTPHTFLCWGPGFPRAHFAFPKWRRGDLGRHRGFCAGLQELLEPILDFPNGAQEILDAAGRFHGGVQRFLEPTLHFPNGAQEILDATGDSVLGSRNSSSPFCISQMARRRSWTPHTIPCLGPEIPRAHLRFP